MDSMECPFVLSANPGTDIWKKPPSTERDNPVTKSYTVVPLKSLQSATITFSAQYGSPYDQVGFLVRITHKPSSALKWIKGGIEFFENEPVLSVACCDQWADWSTAPLPESAVEGVTKGATALTFSLQRKGAALWVYFDQENGRRIPLREIMWLYGLEDQDRWEVEVGAMAARADKDASEPLQANFHAFDVKFDNEQ